MSPGLDPYDADRPLRLSCACGQHGSADEHVQAEAAVATLQARSESEDFVARANAFIEAALVKALFPQDEVRRRFLRAVGRRTRDLDFLARHDTLTGRPNRRAR